jgi:hypothetical protein
MASPYQITNYHPCSRLQNKDGICEYLGHISHATYDSWQAKGIVPGPVTGTNRYDIRAHDHALDLRAGIAGQFHKRSALEEWEEANARAA